MVRQSFSIILVVERGLTDNQVTEWVEEALLGAFVYYSVKAIAVVDYNGMELFYARITVHHHTNVSRGQIRECLDALPAAIRVLEVDREAAPVSRSGSVALAQYSEQ